MKNTQNTIYFLCSLLLIFISAVVTSNQVTLMPRSIQQPFSKGCNLYNGTNFHHFILQCSLHEDVDVYIKNMPKNKIIRQLFCPPEPYSATYFLDDRMKLWVCKQRRIEIPIKYLCEESHLSYRNIKCELTYSHIKMTLSSMLSLPKTTSETAASTEKKTTIQKEKIIFEKPVETTSINKKTTVTDKKCVRNLEKVMFLLVGICISTIFAVVIMTCLFCCCDVKMSCKTKRNYDSMVFMDQKMSQNQRTPTTTPQKASYENNSYTTVSQTKE